MTTRPPRERSQVWETFSQLVDVFGPRLTATAAYNESAAWARDQLTERGVLEPQQPTAVIGGRARRLRQASVVMASLPYHAAMRDERFRRAPAGDGR